MEDKYFKVIVTENLHIGDEVLLDLDSMKCRQITGLNFLKKTMQVAVFFGLDTVLYDYGKKLLVARIIKSPR